MAYALGFPKDVTERIYSMRDWRLEEVKAKGGTKLSREVAVWREPPPPFYFIDYDVVERTKWLYNHGRYMFDDDPDWYIIFPGRHGVGVFDYGGVQQYIRRASLPHSSESFTESKEKKLNIRACCQDLSRPVDHFVCQPCDDEESRIMMRRINAQ